MIETMTPDGNIYLCMYIFIYIFYIHTMVKPYIHHGEALSGFWLGFRFRVSGWVRLGFLMVFQIFYAFLYFLSFRVFCGLWGGVRFLFVFLVFELISTF